MGKWLVGALAAICLPLAAHAGPQIDHPADHPTGHPAGHTRTDAAIQTSYAVAPPASHAYIPQGWALRATFRGRAMDMDSRDWAEDPHAQPGDIEAGYGWREGRAGALIGYEEHDYGPGQPQPARAFQRDPNEPPQVSSDGVLGFSLVLHGR